MNFKYDHMASTPLLKGTVCVSQQHSAVSIIQYKTTKITVIYLRVLLDLTWDSASSYGGIGNEYLRFFPIAASKLKF